MAAAFRPRFLRRSDDSLGEDQVGEPGPGGDGDSGEGAVPGGDGDSCEGAGLGEDQVGEPGRGDGDSCDGGSVDGGSGDGAGAGEEPDDDGDGDGEWLAYELHEWSRESRVMLQQLLTVDQVVHSWQGTTLMVHESLEEKVDGLVDEVEEAEKAREEIDRPIGPDDDLTAFEIGDWSPMMRDELVERLVQARVPYILEQSAGGGDAGDGSEQAGGDEAGEDAGFAGGGDAGDGSEQAGGDEAGEDPGLAGDEEAGGWDLWVRETDEERVDLVIDDMLARVEEADFADLDGLEVNDLLSDLFVACDRLRRDPGDPEGLRGAAAGARRIAGVRTPFGFSAPHWRSLRSTAGELQMLVEGDDTDAEELRNQAHRLGDTLRMLI